MIELPQNYGLCFDVVFEDTLILLAAVYLCNIL